MNLQGLVIDPRKRYLRHPHYHFLLVSLAFFIVLGLGVRDAIATTGSRLNMSLALGMLTFLWLCSVVVHMRARKDSERLHSASYGTTLRLLFLAFVAAFFFLVR